MTKDMESIPEEKVDLTWDTWEDQQEEENRRQREALGQPEIYKFKKGENVLVVNRDKAPREVSTKYGDKTVIEVESEGVTYSLFASRFLVKKIAEKMKETGENKVTVLKSGDGIDTRYEVL